MEPWRQSFDAGQTLRRVWSGLVDGLYPMVCPVCRAETDVNHSLCPDCWRNTYFLGATGCDSCGRPIPGLDCGAADPIRCDDCERIGAHWHKGRAALAYEGAGRRLVLALKHGDRHDLLPMLAGWMARAGAPLVKSADLIVPMPIHWTRRLRRRANQSAEIARLLAVRHDRARDHVPDLLRRIRQTPTQDGKNRHARAQNVAGAFEVPEARRGKLAGREVLLIDDVMTTGASLNEAAKTLREAGAARVNVLVIALVLKRETHYFGSQPDDKPVKPDHED